jgi:hypothetical protein
MGSQFRLRRGRIEPKIDAFFMRMVPPARRLEVTCSSPSPSSWDPQFEQRKRSRISGTPCTTHSLLVSRLLASEHILFVAMVFGGIGALACGYGHFAHTIADLKLRR